MSVSSTYLKMQTQIADEIGQRTDLLTAVSGLTLSPIQNAIQAAIATFEREPFYFNELNDTDGFSTAQGQEFYGASTGGVSYALIGSIAKLDKVHVKVSGNRYSLNPRT